MSGMQQPEKRELKNIHIYSKYPSIIYSIYVKAFHTKYIQDFEKPRYYQFFQLYKSIQRARAKPQLRLATILQGNLSFEAREELQSKIKLT